VQDPETFRAIRALHDKLIASEERAAEAHGALTGEVTGIKTEVVELKMELKEINGSLTEIATSNAELNGIVKVLLSDRHAGVLAVEMTKTTTISNQVNDTLAKRILDEQQGAKKFTRQVWLKIVTGLFSTATIGALITALATGKC
jgi:hypothetical protein